MSINRKVTAHALSPARLLSNSCSCYIRQPTPHSFSLAQHTRAMIRNLVTKVVARHQPAHSWALNWQQTHSTVISAQLHRGARGAALQASEVRCGHYRAHAMAGTAGSLGASGSILSGATLLRKCVQCRDPRAEPGGGPWHLTTCLHRIAAFPKRSMTFRSSSFLLFEVSFPCGQVALL